MKKLGEYYQNHNGTKVRVISYMGRQAFQVVDCHNKKYVGQILRLKALSRRWKPVKSVQFNSLYSKLNEEG